jgi:cytochrome c peroxidase
MHPLEDHRELGMSPDLLVSKLAQVPFYSPLFTAAFGSPEVSVERIRAALAQYVGSLLSYRTRHDLAFNPMDNEPVDPALVLNSEELRGFQLYQARCSGCHRTAASTNEWQANNGLDVVPEDLGTTNAAFQRDGSIGVFRAPSLRNIARSAPYMHDGRFTTLRQVIDHYDSGVKDSQSLDPLLRTTSGPRRLNLAEADKAALEVFLNLLTDEAMLNDPKFSNPFPQ